MRDGTGRKLPIEKSHNNLEVSYDNLQRYIKTRNLLSLGKIRDVFDELGSHRWVFRGHADARWALKTSLERSNLKRDVSGRGEGHLIDIFRSRAHHFLSAPPTNNDYLEWLALMQHHGAPTR